MMFGAWGNPDHDESIRIIHRALDAGINFIDTADVYSRGESEEIVGKALAGGRRDDVVLATKVHGTMGDDPNQFGNSRRWIVTGGREQPAPARHRLDRPLPDPPPRARHRHRRDARRADRPRPRRARSATIGSSTFPARGDRRGAVGGASAAAASASSCEQPPYSILVRGDRGRRAADLPSATAWASSRGARWPAAGCRAASARAQDPPQSARAEPAAGPLRPVASPATSASSRPPTRSPSSPTRPG